MTVWLLQKALAATTCAFWLICGCILIQAAHGAEDPGHATGNVHTFTLSADAFLLDGKPFQIRSGEMHPGRIPREYWRHRIQMAKSLGLNAISFYVFWSQHETADGTFDFSTGNLAIATFLDIMKEEKMWAIIRPGPYVCGEYDFGGIPSHLLRNPTLKIRCMDPDYIAAAQRYLTALAAVIRPYQITHGGPLLMLQIENEYGSYAPGHDREYLGWLSGFWRGSGIDIPFYTADGADRAHMSAGKVMGAAQGMDPGVSNDQFALAHSIGGNPVPAMCSEIYPGWLVHWGENPPPNIPLSEELGTLMSNRRSFNLYMIHGGTNWGFMAGANTNGGDKTDSTGINDSYQPDITSYDYGAPITEQGAPAPHYFSIRKKISSFLTAAEQPPAMPDPIPVMDIPDIHMEAWTSLWDNLPTPILSAKPKTFEVMGQNQGLVLYRHQAPLAGPGQLVLSRLHDYAVVSANGTYIGSLDRRLNQSSITIPAAAVGSPEPALDILVEGMGHINFNSFMVDDRKGITEAVTIDGHEILDWQMYRFPLTPGWITALARSAAPGTHPGGIFKGTFHLDKPSDTFIDMSRYKKGFTWVNGHNLGRYWSIGPQRRLYCPAPWMHPGMNEIIVLDVHETVAQPIIGSRSP